MMTKHELEIIQRGIDEEKKYDIREYPMMPNETRKMRIDLTRSKAEKDELGIKLAESALKSKAKWWEIYFAFGYDAAMVYHKLVEEIREEEREAFRVVVEAYKKNIKEETANEGI